MVAVEVPQTLKYRGGQLDATPVLEFGQRKQKEYVTGDERKAANLDQQLKSLIMFVLSDDQMNSVINCLTAKSTRNDLILYHEGLSDVKESRVMDLKLCYNTFKFKEVNDQTALKVQVTSALKAAFCLNNKGLVAKAYKWDEEEVSLDDNEMVEFKVLMALAEENDAISKEGASNGKQVKISMRKQTLVNMLDEDVVRLCLLIASKLVFMGKEKRNFLMKHIMWLVDDLDAWNAFPWGEYMWEKFYNRTVNVVSRHTEHHLAQLKKNPNFNATYNLYGFAWALKMSNPNVPLIASPEEMSHAWFKDSVEFIKGLDAQDATFLQDDQCREKRMEQHNRMCGDTEDGTFVHRVVGKICPKMNRMSVDDGDGVLDS
ncbi:hypothetical protein Tco_0890797 [Tanacetum coccineum]|uniref:Phospholipase-like protein n=1 Tax=Tanacetum coccineum TaxID=301880 RepID=A0ABQ5C125_9ASTR